MPRTRFVGQPVKTFLHETSPPLTHGLGRDTQLGGDLLIGFTCRTAQYDPAARECLRRLGSTRPPLQRLTLIVDGELVAPDVETGAPNFSRLSRRLGAVRPSRSLMAEVPTRLYVFGLDGEDLCGLAYQERRARLAHLELDANSEMIVVPPYCTDVPVATMLEVAAQNGVEGVVVKRLDS